MIEEMTRLLSDLLKDESHRFYCLVTSIKPVDGEVHEVEVEDDGLEDVVLVHCDCDREIKDLGEDTESKRMVKPSEGLFTLDQNGVHQRVSQLLELLFDLFLALRSLWG